MEGDTELALNEGGAQFEVIHGLVVGYVDAVDAQIDFNVEVGRHCRIDAGRSFVCEGLCKGGSRGGHAKRESRVTQSSGRVAEARV